MSGSWTNCGFDEMSAGIIAAKRRHNRLVVDRKVDVLIYGLCLKGDRI